MDRSLLIRSLLVLPPLNLPSRVFRGRFTQRPPLPPPCRAGTGVFRDDLGVVTAVIIISELEENETEDRRGILAGFKIGVGAEVICRAPEIGFKLFELIFRHSAFSVRIVPTIGAYIVKQALPEIVRETVEGCQALVSEGA
jgi:hypothetical protein